MRSAGVKDVTENGVVAIVRLDSARHLLAVANALVDGGITAIEFTMTTPGALSVLAEASAKLGERVVLGAGTVLDAPTARSAILAGARFVVSPTLSADVIATCRRYSVVSVPGAYTPTEILTAWELGADLVKVFPASTLGPQYLRDVLAPLPQVKLVPTGGVGLENAAGFIRAGAAAVAVGGNLVDRATVSRGDFEAIRERARAFRAIVDEARKSAVTGSALAHVSR